MQGWLEKRADEPKFKTDTNDDIQKTKEFYRQNPNMFKSVEHAYDELEHEYAT